MSYNGILVVDKPQGFTSHDVVARLRRILGERSIGHTGTLDPMATGVLPMLTGRMTRLAQFYGEARKRYEGTLRFGFSTDTCDAEGVALEPPPARKASELTLEELRLHAARFEGRIQQMPPAYSAKKVNGVPAYKLARQQKPVELKPVEVAIDSFEIIDLEGDTAHFAADVSAGTYIRSLARDLGESLGCGAHLSSLRRTASGSFAIAQAHTLAEIEEAGENVGELFLPPRQVLAHLPAVTATPDVVGRIRNGMSVNLPEFSDAQYVRVYASQRLLLAVCQRLAGTLFKPKVVLYGSNEPMPEE
jgi:tRNA pseudouridine55 synthase